ncbi:MAG TPA: alpha/beta fold hydrolase [Actinobacteria bacterium]|nr:alpha/beta fold hydrolase [Actinomycetota bacterium]
MLRSKLPPWLGPAALGAVAVGALLGLAAAWAYSSRIAAELLDARPATVVPDVEVVEVGEGRIVLERTDETVADGRWGLAAADAYGQVSSIARITESTVERAFDALEGRIAPGDEVAVDLPAYPGDPARAHRLGFENVRVPGDLGPNPAWLVDGRRSTWVVVVHGREHGRREALRLLPALVEQGFPVLVVSYRNDGTGTPGGAGVATWGLDEWRDVEAALAVAERKGAEAFVLVGFDAGAEIVASTLHRSRQTSKILGVIFDSPVLDLDDLARDLQPWWAPGPVGALGRLLAEVRWSIDWRLLDQVRRAEEFDVPILVLHGDQDEIVPIDRVRAFVEARPDLVALVSFGKGRHGDLWNVDRVRYEASVTAFLAQVAGAE